MYEWVHGVWCTPIVFALLTPISVKLNKRVGDVLAVGASVLTAVIASLLAFSRLPNELKWSWLRLPILGELYFSLLLDPLSLLFANIVAWISLLVFVYSLSYMKGNLSRYWFLMLLFLGSMELLVLSGNLLQMLMSWELVGVCSYTLISYYYQDDVNLRIVQWVGEPPEEYPPSHCGLKAFLVTRFSDALMLAGLITLMNLTGTLYFTELLSTVPAAHSDLLLFSLILIYMGAAGKSAQLPFMEWLPDAMAGPASVSALIHSATMVKAGVYLTARLSQLVISWSSSLNLSLFFHYIAWTGAFTAFVAALQAAVSSELKKTLAYSTASHIGFMMTALGAALTTGERAIAAASSYLISHALFKSSLFMIAGTLIHLAGSRFYRDMKGAGRYLKKTKIAFILSTLSLMGVPPFAGFWSKEEVFSAIVSDRPAALLAVLTAGVTAFYSVKMVSILLTDSGDRVSDHIEEDLLSSAPYLIPSLLGLILGLAKLFEFASHSTPFLTYMNLYEVTFFHLAATATGALVALVVYTKGLSKAAVDLVNPLSRTLRSRLYINALYYKVADAVSRLAETSIIIEQRYSSYVKNVSRLVRAESGEIVRLQTGILGLRELLWVLAALFLLILIIILAG
ncbi:MAG: NADH-quinone oxidoreductase subunit L [Thermofilaceae archaeon]|nr:NADH-quinone oxidoreductase subunit L [Thermofilaceae archaeon]